MNIIYISTKTSLTEKKEDIENAIKKFTTDKPIWYPTSKILKYPSVYIYIYDFDDDKHKATSFSYMVESVPALCRLKVPTMVHHGKTRLSLEFKDVLGQEYQDVIFPNNSSPVTILKAGTPQTITTGLLYNPNTGNYDDIKETYQPKKSLAPKGCEHSWKEYLGLTDSFDFCEHCDKKR
ncbi:MAG: hypothetical protein COB41_00245 [Proteobacteria bacterium]|nr:MAG: hypothetical protein COB41_00245 [Pseudomonadota bacterium]